MRKLFGNGVNLSGELCGNVNLSALFFQDQELSAKVKKLRKVPLLYISHNTILLEPPSEEIKTKLKETRAIPNTSEIQQESLQQLKEECGVADNVTKKRKRKGPKGPNPLSCKKRKTTEAEAGTTTKRKRKRRKRHK